MYYAFIQNNKIIGSGEATLLNQDILNFEITKDIFENLKNYIWNGENLILDPELEIKKLNKLKEEKIVENDTLRDEVLNQGVLYKNVLFDSDTDQKVNLLAMASSMGDTDTITWYGIDNHGLLCTKADIVAIGGLITELHSFCWNNNAYIKEQIEGAETISDLEKVEIDYDRTDTQLRSSMSD